MIIHEYQSPVLRAFRPAFTNSVAIAAIRDDSTGLYVGQQLVLKKVEESSAITPILTLAPAQAQELMDDLWMCGLRPTEGSGSSGSLAATQRHLEDMRKLVFKKDFVPTKI